LFCDATSELTALSLLKHWTWPVVALDMSWGCFVTALSSTVGLTIANWLAPGFDGHRQKGTPKASLFALPVRRYFGCGTIRI
jgi:hypothetical protein